jgi:hypothetical protein
MERAARLIKNKNVSRQIVGDEDIARAAWPEAVGKAVTAHTLRLYLVRATLVVEVEDAIWQKQLYALSGQILQRLRQLTGTDQIENIEFRIGAPRRQPQRAECREATSTGDESDRIQDPVLKKVYRLSRRKATG